MSAGKPNILLAGLTEDLNSKFSEILKKNNFNVLVASNSDEILSNIKENYPELMIMDYNSKSINSIETVKNFKTTPAIKKIPILMIIDTEKPLQTEKGIEAGCDDFIGYNIEETELLTRIKTFIKINTYRLLLDEKEKFEEILNEISDGVIVLRPDWTIEKFNKNAMHLVNLPKNASGINFIEHCRENFSITKNLYEYIDSPEKELTFELIREDKTSVNPLYILVKCNFIKSPYKKNIRIILTLRNITESKIEEMLKQDFLSLISHKLRTPIVALTYSMKLVMNRKELNYSEEELDGFLSNAYKKAKEVNDLIEKLLVFSTVVNDKMFIKFEPINLAQSIKDNIEIFINSKGKESGKEIEVKYNFNDDDERKVVFSEEYIKIIFENLLDNGIKFNDKEKVVFNIGIEDENENYYKVYVKDNGPGIPHEEYENIFKKFYQVERYFTGSVEGIGIGLALIKHILETYDCEIWVESKIGEGSTFYFTLPKFKANQ